MGRGGGRGRRLLALGVRTLGGGGGIPSHRREGAAALPPCSKHAHPPAPPPRGASTAAGGLPEGGSGRRDARGRKAGSEEARWEE